MPGLANQELCPGDETRFQEKKKYTRARPARGINFLDNAGKEGEVRTESNYQFTDINNDRRRGIERSSSKLSANYGEGDIRAPVNCFHLNRLRTDRSAMDRRVQGVRFLHDCLR